MAQKGYRFRKEFADLEGKDRYDMNVKNCRMCGRIFNYVAGPFLCQACREKMEVKFQEVKEYIRSNPGATIPEVSEKCDVDASQIRQWLREERLELAENSAIMLYCESCGAPIRSGRYCEKCKLDTTRGFRDILNQNKPKAPEPLRSDDAKSRMRFL